MLGIVIAIIGVVLAGRIFYLQILHGEEALNDFTLKICKERSIPSTRGIIYDRNGKVLAQTVNGERKYNSNSTVRRATLHAVGDLEGFISTGAHSAFRGGLTGYSVLNGVYDLKRN